MILRIENNTSKTLKIYVEARGSDEFPPKSHGSITLDIIDIEIEESGDAVQESG